jgi:hypothetical protein
VTELPRRAHPLRTNWRQPVVSFVAMAVSVGLVSLVDDQPGPLILAAVLALTLSRNRLIRTWRGRAESLIGLPFVALATAGVGYLLVHLPIVGATAYVTAMFLSIFLRRFGPVWSRIGTLIALPFITLLIAPGAGTGTTPLGVALLSIAVLAIVVALQLLAEVTKLLPRPQQAPPATAGEADASEPQAGATQSGAAEPTPPPRPGLRPSASTRMAIQMAIALAAAFTIGGILFPQHVTWVVLTAFIVCSGNRGRADVLYKSGLRIVGAAIGTILATIGLVWLTPAHPLLQGPPLVIVLLLILGLGLWLREWTYAAWAVVMTLVITLLRSAAVTGVEQTSGDQLWIRILAIVVGAACGVLASWFVLPVRSEGVLRRRIGGALRAISEYVAEQNTATEHDLDDSLQKLDEVAAPWHALDRATPWRSTARKPGRWMLLVHESAALVRANPAISGKARRALGEARRSLRDPQLVGPTLLALRDALREQPTDNTAA